MGQLATRGGLSRLLFDATRACVGHRRGGLAVATIGGCAGFGAVCGSSLATAATMASVALPEMRRHGYSGALAAGTLAAGGDAGYPVSAIDHPGDLRGHHRAVDRQAVPGRARTGHHRDARLRWCDRGLRPGEAGRRDRRHRRCRSQSGFGASQECGPVVGRLLSRSSAESTSGYSRPRRAAAIGAAAIGLVAVVSGHLRWRAFSVSLLDTARATGMIFLILIGAEVFNAFLALTQIPATLADAPGGLRAGACPDPSWHLARLPGSRLRDGQPSDDPADRAGLLPGRNGARLRLHGGGGRHLVRRDGAGRRRDRADHAADRPQRPTPSARWIRACAWARPSEARYRSC